MTQKSTSLVECLACYLFRKNFDSNAPPVTLANTLSPSIARLSAITAFTSRSGKER